MATSNYQRCRTYKGMRMHRVTFDWSVVTLLTSDHRSSCPLPPVRAVDRIRNRFPPPCPYDVSGHASQATRRTLSSKPENALIPRSPQMVFPSLPRFFHPLSSSRSLVLSLSRSLALSLSRSLALSLSRSFALSLCHSHSLTLSPSHSLTLSLSHSLTLSLSHPLTL